ncbi:MAG: dihydrolipoyl dehydrogenase family protein [Chloroflexota bacterium]
MATTDYDVLVIGGGTAGMVAALRCAGTGLHTALVERDRLGGECLWTGCVPAKAMLYSAEVRRLMSRADEFGLEVCAQPLNWSKVVRAKDDVVRRVAELESPAVLARGGVEYLRGAAGFLSPREVKVDGRTLRARNFVIATGSRQAEPRRVPGLAETGYITHVEAINLPALPSTLAVIGGGPVGCEFAQIFKRMGSRVIILERSETILAREDPQAARFIQRLLVKEGIEVRPFCTVVGVRRQGHKKVILLEVGAETEELAVDEVMLATGRSPNVEALQCERIGLQRGPWGLEVDEYLRTSLPHVYACGDVTGQYLFSHTAEYQGRIAAHNIAFPDDLRRTDYRVVPWATFTDPEVAHLGLTEPEAREAGYDITVECFPFTHLDRALVIRKAEGIVKIIGDNRTGQLLGAHIVGPGAGNIIHEYALAMRARLPLSEVADTIHAYPTLSEALKWAATQFTEEQGEET